MDRFNISRTVAPPLVRITCDPATARKLSYLLSLAVAALEPGDEYEANALRIGEELIDKLPSRMAMLARRLRDGAA